MSNLKDIAQHSTEICVASAALATGTATGIGAFAIPAAALAGIGATIWNASADRACKNSVKQILKDMEGRPGIDEAALARAAKILRDNKKTLHLDPRALAAAAKNGQFEEEASRILLNGLPFQDGDYDGAQPDRDLPQARLRGLLGLRHIRQQSETPASARCRPRPQRNAEDSVGRQKDRRGHQ